MPVPKKTYQLVKRAYDCLSKALRTNRLKAYQRDPLEQSYKKIDIWLNDNIPGGKA